MATDSKTSSSSTTADTQDLGSQVTSNVAAADDIAVQRIQTLAWVHQARAAQLARSAASLKAQYGADDAGVKSAEAATAAATATAAQVAVVNNQVATADPEVAANGWALHGRVFDADLTPASGYTVFLVDTTKSYQQAYGFTYTDDTGYFLLNYSGPAASSKTSGQTAPSELFIEVVNASAQPVFLSTTAFQPVTGSAVYQNIVLPAEQQPIGDPPAEIRDVAIPKAPKKKKS